MAQTKYIGKDEVLELAAHGFSFSAFLGSIGEGILPVQLDTNHLKGAFLEDIGGTMLEATIYEEGKLVYFTPHETKAKLRQHG